MGEVLGIGVTHYPPFMSGKPESYAGILKGIMRSPNVPDEMKDPANWPSGMQDEWNNEIERAEEHQSQHREAFLKVRAAIMSLNLMQYSYLEMISTRILKKQSFLHLIYSVRLIFLQSLSGRSKTYGASTLKK